MLHCHNSYNCFNLYVERYNVTFTFDLLLLSVFIVLTYDLSCWKFIPTTSIKLLNNLIIKFRWYFECHVSVLMLKYEETIINSIPAAVLDEQSATRCACNATISSVFSPPIHHPQFSLTTNNPFIVTSARGMWLKFLLATNPAPFSVASPPEV